MLKLCFTFSLWYNLFTLCMAAGSQSFPLLSLFMCALSERREVCLLVHPIATSRHLPFQWCNLNALMQLMAQDVLSFDLISSTTWKIIKFPVSAVQKRIAKMCKLCLAYGLTLKIKRLMKLIYIKRFKPECLILIKLFSLATFSNVTQGKVDEWKAKISFDVFHECEKITFQKGGKM